MGSHHLTRDELDSNDGSWQQQIMEYSGQDTVNEDVDNYDRHVDTDIHQTRSQSPFPTRQVGRDCYNNNSCDNSIFPQSGNESTMTSQAAYSVTKVRTILSLVTTLGSVAFSLKPTIAQYLLDRWSDEIGHSRSHVQNGSSGEPNRGLCSRNESDPWVVKDDDIQARVSVETMYYSFATIVPALLSCLLFGSLVDIAGRKPALISALAGSTSQIIVTICIVSFNLHPNFFYLAYALDGIGGSFFVNLIACFSITADVSGHKNSRILGIAILTVLSTSAFATFNVAVGLLIKHFGYIVAFSTTLAPVALSLLIVIIFLPETLPMKKQTVTFKRLWDYTTRIFYLYSRDGDKRRRWSLFIALMIFFTSVLNLINVNNIDTLYQRHEPLCWDSAQLGYFSAFRNSGAYIAALVYLCVCRFFGCASDELLSMVGMLFVAGSFVLEAFATNTWQMYMVPVLTIPGSNIAPVTRGVMSILAGPDKQGVMFSSIALIEVMCSLAATVTYNKVYAVTVDFMPGFVYLVMAGMSLVTFMLFIPFFHFYDGPQQSYETLIQARDDNDASMINSSASSTDDKEFD